MKQVIELLGKTVNSYIQRMVISLKNKEKVTEVLLSLSGENKFALDEQELYLLSDLLELEIV